MRVRVIAPVIVELSTTEFRSTRFEKELDIPVWPVDELKLAPYTIDIMGVDSLQILYTIYNADAEEMEMRGNSVVHDATAEGLDVETILAELVDAFLKAGWKRLNDWQSQIYAEDDEGERIRYIDDSRIDSLN